MVARCARWPSSRGAPDDEHGAPRNFGRRRIRSEAHLDTLRTGPRSGAWGRSARLKLLCQRPEAGPSADGAIEEYKHRLLNRYRQGAIRLRHWASRWRGCGDPGGAARVSGRSICASPVASGNVSKVHITEPMPKVSLPRGPQPTGSVLPAVPSGRTPHSGAPAPKVRPRGALLFLYVMWCIITFPMD